MRVKQKRPFKYVRSPSPPPPLQLQPADPAQPPSPTLHPSPIGSDIVYASIASMMVEVSRPFSCSSIGGTSSFIACRNMKRKADDTTIFNIPKSLLHNIFLRIPALTLRSMTKRVCKEWNGKISDSHFVREHSRLNASDGFLVQKFVYGKNYPSLSYFIEIRNDTNAVTIHPTSLLSETVYASSGGFIYIKECTPALKFSVLDPVSGRKLNLPPSPKLGESLLLSGFAQDLSTGVYKVVHFYGDGIDKFCFVLSLVVESQWRPIDVEYFTCTSSLERLTISAGRYVYCVTWLTSRYFDIITFDAETEWIYRCSPTYVRIDGRDYLLRMEDSMSLVVGTSYIWRFWKFNIFNPHVWKRICKIDLSSQRLLIDRKLSKGDVFIKPIACLRNGELILFHLTYPSQCCIAYDPSNNLYVMLGV